MERYLDPEEVVEERVKDLLARLTLEEKLAQLGSVDLNTLVQVFSRRDEDELEGFVEGIGVVSCGVVGEPGVFTTPGEQATFVNELQEWLLHNTRLGIPALVQARPDQCASLSLIHI